MDEPSVTFDLFLGCKIFVQIYQREVMFGPTICTFATIGHWKPHFCLKCDDHPLNNWNLWVKTKKIATLTFFMDSYIFSDRCLKNHKIFIFHFLSTFSEKLWKFSPNQVQNFLFVVFWTLHKKSCRITY